MAESSAEKQAEAAQKVRAAVRRRLLRSSRNSSQATDLLDVFGDRILEHLHGVRVTPARVLALGAGPASWFQAVSSLYPDAELCAAGPSEHAFSIERRWWQRRVSLPAVAHYADALPYAEGAFGLVVSNLVASEPLGLGSAIGEAARVLEPGGLYCASFLGPDTFREFGDTWTELACEPGVTPFVDMHDIGDILARNGFSDVVMDSETLTLTYESATAAVAECHGLGIGNVNPNRPSGLTGRSRWQRFLDTYPLVENRAPLTVELNYAHAWRNPPDGSVEVTLR